MNNADGALAIGGLIIQMVGVAYVYGKLAQKTSDNARRIDVHEETLRIQALKLNDHDVEISKLIAYNQGFNAGVSRQQAAGD